MTARTLRSDIISLDKIDADNIIIGLSSCGRTPWEDVYNSGIGSNGFTNARHDVLSPYYKKRYPETFSPETDKKLIYRGEYKLGDEVPVFFGMSTSGMNIGELLLSPTRTYAPFLRALHKELGAKDYKKLITGVIHNSGGGQKKVLSYLRPGLRVWKSALHSVLQPPPVFGLLFGAMEKHASSFHKKEKELLWEAYKTFNMGQRMEIYCKDEKTAATIISLAGSMNLGAFVIGEVLVSGARYKRDVVIKTFSGMEVVYELTS
jgi:phosphoribosylformylglycinamidine cyclo-ligase